MMKLLAVSNIALVAVWIILVLKIWWKDCCWWSGLSPFRMAFICPRQICRKKDSLNLEDDDDE